MMTLSPLSMGRQKQRIEIGVGAKNRIHDPIIAHIVAEITHRRFKKWRDPNGINSQDRKCNRASG